jgi:hypothetical protein
VFDIQTTQRNVPSEVCAVNKLPGPTSWVLDNSRAVNRPLKVATTGILTNTRHVPLDCVAALLASPASSLALTVTSRAFEAFHTEWRCRLD